jgi:hypothetical protein
MPACASGFQTVGGGEELGSAMLLCGTQRWLSAMLLQSDVV